eukprot:6927277-Prymnesium_polylepis.1
MVTCVRIFVARALITTGLEDLLTTTPTSSSNCRSASVALHPLAAENLAAAGLSAAPLSPLLPRKLGTPGHLMGNLRHESPSIAATLAAA